MQACKALKPRRPLPDGAEPGLATLQESLRAFIVYRGAASDAALRVIQRQARQGLLVAEAYPQERSKLASVNRAIVQVCIWV